MKSNNIKKPRFKSGEFVRRGLLRTQESGRNKQDDAMDMDRCRVSISAYSPSANLQRSRKEKQGPLKPPRGLFPGPQPRDERRRGWKKWIETRPPRPGWAPASFASTQSSPPVKYAHSPPARRYHVEKRKLGLIYNLVAAQRGIWLMVHRPSVPRPTALPVFSTRQQHVTE
jgi:hypothetical protein